jgi:hypothetical protein
LWAICGSAVHQWESSRMVGYAVFDMPLMADEVPGFYPKM